MAARLIINLSMFGLIYFLFVSVGIVLWSIWVFGPVITLPLLVAALGVVFGIIQLLRLKLRKPANWVVVDGSNVLYWENEGKSFAVNSIKETDMSKSFHNGCTLEKKIRDLDGGKELDNIRRVNEYMSH